MEFQPLQVDRLPIDDELIDDGHVGPELAHLARAYVRSPRALVWRNPSSDWRLFAVMVPLASRLSLMVNPIFAQLARAWGLNLRFVGVDRDQRVYDFRALLSDRAIRLLVDAIAHSVEPHALAGVRAEVADTAAHRALDVLFAALAGDLLTVLERRRDDWGRHLLTEHRLEPGASGSLFERDTRYPDFLAALRQALRNEIIDAHFYGRALRAIDLREQAIEQRLAAIIEASLDPVVFAKLARTPVGRHLGAYNWLRLDPRRAAARRYALSRLPAFATFFAESLITLETLGPMAAGIRAPATRAAPPVSESIDPALHGDGRLDELPEADHPAQVPTLDLRGLAARRDTTHSLRWASQLRAAIEAGQDRQIIEALAQRFAVDDNVIRRLWREPPAALGVPPTWHLAQILRRLQAAGDRQWPGDASAWQRLMAEAVPVEAG